MPFIAPQLLERSQSAPDGDNWLHEIKYDGYRLLTCLEHGRVSLFSRPGANWTTRLPSIAAALGALANSGAYLDGELVYLAPNGVPDFEALQQTTHARRASGPLYYQVFDLLRLRGEDLTGRPLIERKALLQELLASGAENPRLRYVSHVVGEGPAFFAAADGLALEGIVSKRATSLYRPGERSRDWLKVKCFRTHRFDVVGFTTETRDDGPALASLVLAGRSRSGTAVYAGRVEFGVPSRDRTLLHALQRMSVPTAPLAHAPEARTVTWVTPRLSAEVRCLAWEPGRYIRHAVVRGLAVSEV
jgi:bifunctional non-homologous end joining protein LigD